MQLMTNLSETMEAMRKWSDKLKVFKITELYTWNKWILR